MSQNLEESTHDTLFDGTKEDKYTQYSFWWNKN